MKKLNKLFGLMLIAGCSMSLASNVNAAVGTCTATNTEELKEQGINGQCHVIEIPTGFLLTDNVEVINRRVVVHAGNLQIPSGYKLTLKDFTIDTADTSNVNLLINSGASVTINGELEATKTYAENKSGDTGVNAAAVAIGNRNGDVIVGTTGVVKISGYEHTGIRVNNLKVAGAVEVSNCDNGINSVYTQVTGSGKISAHDNKNGVTGKLTVTDNGVVEAYSNAHTGLTLDTGSKFDKNAEVNSHDNHTDPDLDSTLGKGRDVSLNDTVTVDNNATFNAGLVGATSRGTSASAKVSVSSKDAEVSIEKVEQGATFEAPNGMKGIVRSGNWVLVYSLEGDTVEITYSDSLGDGVVGVMNYTDNTIKVVTPDSNTVDEVSKNSQKIYQLIKITAKVDDKVSEGEVVVFEGDTLADISKAGKEKLDEMLGKEGQNINNYVVSAGQALTSTYPFRTNTQLTATYYIILKFGDVEIYANPNTRLSDLGEKDKATLEKIKNATGRKFMYFAVNGKAISETDTVFDKDTEFLVLYEGDAAPVVPDVEPEPGEPSKPDDGTDPVDPERDPEAGEKLPENQPTGDNVMGSVAMGIAGLVGIVGSALVFDKKTNYNN